MKQMSEEVYDKWLPLMGEEDLNGYLKAGMGLRVDWGEKPALILVDLTNNFVDTKHAMANGDAGVQAVTENQKLVEACRRKNIPIFFVRPKKRTALEMGVARDKWGSLQVPKEGTDWYDWADGLMPTASDAIIEKTKSSAFFDTSLRSMLTYLNIDTLIITGISTSGCVRSTIVDAFFCNYRVIVPEECCADRSKKAHQFSLFDIDMKYGDVTPTDQVLSHIDNLPSY